jgi:IS5 family transposase
MEMQRSFGSLELSHRVRRDGALMKVDGLIDWELMRPLFKGLYKRDMSHGGGQEPFDAVMMFKAILLGQWHSLSDRQLEESLLVRLDFMQFCGLDLSADVPDETTLCRFRNRLIKAELLEGLLQRINEQLQSHGLMVKEARGAVLDATLIESASRPLRTITIEKDDSGGEVVYEDGSSPGVKCEVKMSADVDATWVKKGKDYFFGYRGYLVADACDGYVIGVHTAPANQSEMVHFKAAVESSPLHLRRVYADKGLSSKENRSYLRKKKIKSAIMHRAVKNKPLSARQKLANRLISKRRVVIERCFGTLKRLFEMERASYCGTIKVKAQLILKSICMNCLKAANKILDIHPSRGEIRPVSG